MLANWNLWYPNCAPIGHRLRFMFPDRWVRFHSLPESKRYPENETEYAEVLARHNSVLRALVQQDEHVVLLTTGYSESIEPTRYYAKLLVVDPHATPWRTVAMHDADEGFAYPTYWHIFASQWAWRPGQFDPIMRLVANHTLANVIIVADDCRWALHPYDGGMDVIVDSQAARTN